MTQLKPLLLLTVIFIIGIITGSALTYGLSSHWSKPPGEQQVKARWMARLTKGLNLTADQQAKIEPIVTDADNQIQAVHHDEVGRATQILDAANKQIEALLTPEQQEEMKKMQAEREKQFPGRMRPWEQRGPGDRPRGEQGDGSRGGPGGMPPRGPGDNQPPPPPPTGATNSAPAAKPH